MHKEPNILLNSTILSNLFENRSFHAPIHELSNEAEFIEEGDGDSAGSGEESFFFKDGPKEGLSKIYNHNDPGSFSFDNNRNVLSGLLDEEIIEHNYRTEDSLDTLERREGLDQ